LEGGASVDMTGASEDVAGLSGDVAGAGENEKLLSRRRSLVGIQPEVGSGEDLLHAKPLSPAAID